MLVLFVIITTYYFCRPKDTYFKKIFCRNVHIIFVYGKKIFYICRKLSIMKNNRRIFYTLIVILVTIGVSLAVQLVLADDAAARPGGGHGFRGGGGYHGGGSHYHGSGSGGGSFFINFTGSFGTDLIINLLIWAIILWISSKFKSGHDDDSVSSVATLENRRQE